MQLTERQKQWGVVLDRLGTAQWQQTEEACTRILAKDSVDVEALFLLGLSVAARGQTQRAAAIFDRVARERPNDAHPCGDIPALLPRFSRAQAAAQFRACLKLSPEDFRLRQAFATFLMEGGEGQAAVAVLREGLALHPRSAPAQHGMGLALAELGQNEQAIWHFQRAVALDPGLAPSWANLGLLLKVERQFDRSLAAYARAIAEAPNDAQIRVNRAVALLQAGRWEEAWPEYEWRLRVKGAVSLPVEFLLPALREAGDLAGRTILLTHEEGFGDTIQFLRFAPLLAERGARVLAWVPAPLVRLVRSVLGADAVFTGDGTPPQFDFHCPFVSLPRAFESTPATVPARSYLSADPMLASAWARQLPSGKMLVGLAWAGQARPWLPGFSTVDRRRSAGLAAFLPLAAVPGVHFVSLQKGPAQEQVQFAPGGMALCDPMAGAQDFADTAAIIANLDLVVSVDTAVVHLAGALGKPVFLIDRYDNCWRWLSGRASSPWYPNLTIFRQETLGDWSVPMGRAAAALQAMAAYRGTGRRPPEADG